MGNDRATHPWDVHHFPLGNFLHVFGAAKVGIFSNQLKTRETRPPFNSVLGKNKEEFLGHAV